MKIASMLSALALGSVFFTSQANAAATLLVTDGILTGADNVTVTVNNVDTLYNVRFADGSCFSLFNNCTMSSLAFSNLTSARSAAQALLDQVFVNGPDGNFDDFPDKTSGCTDATYCFTYVPYSTAGTVLLAQSLNYSLASGFADLVLSGGNSRGFDTTLSPVANYAIFTLVPVTTNVPEPTSATLIGIALAGLRLTRRKAKK